MPFPPRSRDVREAGRSGGKLVRPPRRQEAARAPVPSTDAEHRQTDGQAAARRMVVVVVVVVLDSARAPHGSDDAAMRPSTSDSRALVEQQQEVVVVERWAWAVSHGGP